MRKFNSCLRLGGRVEILKIRESVAALTVRKVSVESLVRIKT